VTARSSGANANHEAYRARGVMKDGSPVRRPAQALPAAGDAAGKVNLTDPDSRLVKGMRGWLQGYNAQAVTNERQIVIAAEVMVASPDFGHLEPMLNAARSELRAACVTETAQLLADAGYWHHQQMQRIADQGIQLLVPPDSSRREAPRPGWDGGHELRFGGVRLGVEVCAQGQLNYPQYSGSAPPHRDRCSAPTARILPPAGAAVAPPSETLRDSLLRRSRSGPPETLPCRQPLAACWISSSIVRR
jgi:hypothetical protein